MSNLPRTQHIVATGAVAIVGIWVTYLSFTQQPSDAFLFPRLISTVFVVLALWTFGEAVLGHAKVGEGLSLGSMINLAPGVLVAIIYVFWAARTFGFYTASTVTFFVLLSLYDPAPHGQVRSWIIRAIITAGFLAVMYGLFAMLLKVYTPREIFF